MTNLKKFQIRAAHLSDALGIARIHVDVWNSTYSGIIPQEYLNSRTYENVGQKWINIIEKCKPRNHLWVAESNSNEIVGFASGGECRDSKDPFDGELYALYLVKSLQRSGIGRRLFEATMNQLLLDRFTSMKVWVLEENPAIGFYEKMGGKFCDEKVEEIGGKPLKERSYSWDHLQDSMVKGDSFFQ